MKSKKSRKVEKQQKPTNCPLLIGWPNITVLTGTCLITRWGSPVDNRPSTNQLHRLTKERKKKKKITCDM